MQRFQILLKWILIVSIVIFSEIQLKAGVSEWICSLLFLCPIACFVLARAIRRSDFDLSAVILAIVGCMLLFECHHDIALRGVSMSLSSILFISLCLCFLVTLASTPSKTAFHFSVFILAVVVLTGLLLLVSGIFVTEKYEAIWYPSFGILVNALQYGITFIVLREILRGMVPQVVMIVLLFAKCLLLMMT